MDEPREQGSQRLLKDCRFWELLTTLKDQITALKLKSVLGGPGGRLQRGKVTPKAAGTASGGVGDPSASMTPAPDFSDHLFS